MAHAQLLDIEAQLLDLSAQIAALDVQLAPLQAAHDAVFRRVAQFEAENKHKNLTRPVVPKHHNALSHQNTLLHHNVAIADDPPLIHFSYFDDSIRHYFQNGSLPSEPAVGRPAPEKVLDHIDVKTRGAQNALEELVWRLGGVSAFPINDRLYDNTNDALLGLRFDILSHVSLRFVQPHYIILRRRADKSIELKWLVFRYTTPPYVPLASFSHLLKVDRLHDFAHLVRSCLVRTQYKHDKFEAVAQLTYREVLGVETEFPDSVGTETKLVTVEKDLECRRVSLHIENHSGVRKQVHTIELECGHSSIDKVKCKLAEGSTEQNIYVETSLANCGFTSLASSLKTLAKYLRNQGLL